MQDWGEQQRNLRYGKCQMPAAKNHHRPWTIQHRPVYFTGAIFPGKIYLKNKKERIFGLSAGTLGSLAQIEAYETPNLPNSNDDMDMD